MIKNTYNIDWKNKKKVLQANRLKQNICGIVQRNHTERKIPAVKTPFVHVVPQSHSSD
jgi:hypothetical protein